MCCSWTPRDKIVGAVGVSGDTSDNDEAALVPAVQAVGLVADTGDAPA
ncbi:heme-binding protein [Bordetella sp. BOR01]|nr:heme-binding protein [Bordetella sp. BOR01]